MHAPALTPSVTIRLHQLRGKQERRAGQWDDEWLCALQLKKPSQIFTFRRSIIVDNVVDLTNGYIVLQKQEQYINEILDVDQRDLAPPATDQKTDPIPKIDQGGDFRRSPARPIDHAGSDNTHW
jgi:hypothetical protein